MELSEIRDFCLQLPAVHEDIKWENHLCFNVVNKMFLLTSPDEVPVTASFKVSEDDFVKLTALPGIKPAPYLGRYSWVQAESLDALPKKKWEYYLKEAYRLVASRLKTSEKKKFGINF